MTNRLVTGKKIAIIGGGPGGLTLARLLQTNGAEVTVYERDLNKDTRQQGATLDLHDNSGLKALQYAGLIDAFKANYRPGADKLRLMDKDGNILVDQHLDEETENLTFGHESFRPEIDRRPLRDLLIESLKPGTIIWNSRFVSMQTEGNGWQLRFENGAVVSADLVVAADGANSKIRPYVTPIKPLYSGITVMEGAVHHAETAAPLIYQLLKGGKIFALGNDQSLIVSSKGDGSLAFYTGCKTEENWIINCGIDFTDKMQVLAWFKEVFKEWDASWEELFEQSDVSFMPRPQYYMPFDQNWEPQSNVTLLGDAAHLMPPYAGEGVNMAMLDALELSLCLTNTPFPDMRSAIAHYEQQMRNRAAETARVTMESTLMLHSPEALSFINAIFSRS